MPDHDEEYPSVPAETTEENVKFYVGTVDFDDGEGYRVVVYLSNRGLAVCLSPEAARTMAHSLLVSADQVQPPLIELDEP